MEKRDPVAIHFSDPDHKGTDELIIHVLFFITLHPQSRKSLELRLQVEKKWIHKFRCPAPHGINIFD